MGMPGATGLFHRAIIESGAHPRAVPRPLATLLARRTFEALGLEVGDVEGLQAIPGEELFARVEQAIESIDDPELPSGRRGTVDDVLAGAERGASAGASVRSGVAGGDRRSADDRDEQG